MTLLLMREQGIPYIPEEDSSRVSTDMAIMDVNVPY